MPPPPKPSGTPLAPQERGDRRDDERKSAAAEAERLAREHSNKREMKMRQERARAFDDGKTPPPARSSRPSGATGVPGVPGAPVVQPVVRPPQSSRVPEEARESRESRTPAAARPAERPPVEKLERPVAQPPTAHDDVHGAAASTLIDEVAVEAEELLREAGAVWSRWSVADRISVFSALLMLIGTFLPWLWRKNEEVVIGIGSGGILHAVVAVTAIVLLVRRERLGVDERGLRPTPARRRQLARRTALWLLLLALVSTVAGTWLLLVWGAVRRFEVPTLEIEPGLYLTLAAGLGLSYSGFAHFWRREPQR